MREKHWSLRPVPSYLGEKPGLDGESCWAPQLELVTAGPAYCSWSVQHIKRASDLLQALAAPRCLGARAFPFCKMALAPTHVGSSSFLPPALQTPKQGGWQPLPDQACPPLDTSFYSQENTQPHKTTKSHRRGTRRMGTALGSAAIPTHGVGTSSLSSPQTLSWCGKLFLGS